MFLSSIFALSAQPINVPKVSKISTNKKDNNILFVDASEEFVKKGDKNKLEDENQNRIVNAYQERKEEKYFTKLVSNDEVLSNGANLSVSSYVEKEDKREVIDIVALNEEIEALSKDVRNRSVELDEMIKEL